MAWIDPRAEEYLRRRFTRADAYRFAPPGSPEAKMPGWIDPSATRVRLREAQEEEARAQAEAAQEEFERELLQLRWEVKKLKLEHELWLFDQKYIPSQPRVPAGNPDGGQWTSGGGGTGAVSGSTRLADAATNVATPTHTVLSDATPDPILPGARYAQDTTGRYSVNLDEEEARGGHTLDKHVNKSPEVLIAQAREAFDRNPRAQDSRSGSFPSFEDATRLVNSTLAQNRDIVDQVASGTRFRDLVQSRFGSVTGIEAVMPSINSPPYIRNTYGVGVVIENDPSSPRGYRIVTGFPTNR